jgi:hypothetical protein
MLETSPNLDKNLDKSCANLNQTSTTQKSLQTINKVHHFNFNSFCVQIKTQFQQSKKLHKIIEPPEVHFVVVSLMFHSPIYRQLN